MDKPTFNKVVAILAKVGGIFISCKCLVPAVIEKDWPQASYWMLALIFTYIVIEHALMTDWRDMVAKEKNYPW